MQSFETHNNIFFFTIFAAASAIRANNEDDDVNNNDDEHDNHNNTTINNCHHGLDLSGIDLNGLRLRYWYRKSHPIENIFTYITNDGQGKPVMLLIELKEEKVHLIDNYTNPRFSTKFEFYPHTCISYRPAVNPSPYDRLTCVFFVT